MKIPTIPSAARWVCAIWAAAVLTASAVIAYPAARNETVSELNVTVYNSNIALVRDVRSLLVPVGAFRLKFMDIAATVNPATVHFRSLIDPEKLGVIEQNYEYDLLEPAKLLHK